MMQEQALPSEVENCSDDHFARADPRVQPVAKRAFDFVAAIVLLVITLPVACLIALLIAVSGQSPFSSHKRIGRGGREFNCLKFTTMLSDAEVGVASQLPGEQPASPEWETTETLRRDKLLTPIGSVLRATSLDELPQLLNILAGQMSFVGPWPVTRHQLEKFYGNLGAAAYTSVRPGLTGVLQATGQNELSSTNRVAFDTLYVQRLSFRTDLGILAKSIGVAVGRRGPR